MVTFRCKRSGNLVSFTAPEDIDGLRKHEGYEEVIEPKKEEDPIATVVVKARGRPKKTNA